MSKNKKLLKGFALLLISGGIFLYFAVVWAQSLQKKPILNPVNLPAEQDYYILDNSFKPLSSHFFEPPQKRIWVIVTGYSSSPLETDDTPFITASGTFVREGIVACNFLPFGTKIRIPKLFGGEVFVVEDRMHPRKKYQVDVWFPSREEALQFGAHLTYIEVLE